EQVFSQTVGRATSLLPPSLARNGNAETVAFDIFKARQALGDSRYRDVNNLPEVTFTVPGTRSPPPSEVLALINMIQQHLGVRIRIQRESYSTFVENLDRRANPYQLFLFTWRAEYPDPQAVLDPLFRSSSVSNYSSYRSPDVDALLLQARGEHDSGRRRQTLAEIEQRIATDSPVTPLWHGKSYVLVKPWVRDVQLSATARPWLNRVHLSS
ncbi:MAG: ABC transporter substrate-binding protein, partial [Chloroflexota bacterium]|nr:ABC transporter substrate-binding protein [Chloroflexota bacterium]